MGLLLFGGSDYLSKIQSVRPQNLVSLWPQNEPSGGISTEIVRQYNGAYTGVTLGQPGVPGSGMTSPFYDGANDFNNIYTAGFANDNLLLNPGFETPGAMPPTWANWVDIVGDGAIANEVVIVHEGLDACKLTSGVLRNTNEYQTFAVVPGVRYRSRFYTRGDAVTETRYQIRDLTNAANIINKIGTGVSAAAWSPIVDEWTAPAGCISVRFFAHCGNLNGAVAYFDACEVRRMDGFLGDQGTIIAWAQVANAGVWTDGLARYIIGIRVGAENFIILRKEAANNTIGFFYEAGNVQETQATAALANLDFATYGMTWDISAGATGEVRYYIDGIASGATDVALGTWVGDLNVASTVLGASSTVPAAVWSGNIGPVPVWSAALSPDEMRYLGAG